IDKPSQHLAQLYNKAFDAKMLNEIIENSKGKFSKKKAGSLLYDSIINHFSILCKKKSQ
ncbi:42778_t:CDS:2, partial [Gigaspora margarita]